MTPTRATLLTLVQCRGLWFWHFWGAIICLTVLTKGVIAAGSRESAVFSLMVIPLWTGVVSASLCKDLLTKPFSFCTPRHSRTWRTTLFTIALVVAGVGALAVLIPAAGTPGLVALTGWLTFCLGLAAFMAAVLLATATANTGFLPALITVLMFISVDDNVAERIRTSAGSTLLALPVLTTVICAAILFAAWRMLGSRRFTRRLCGEAFLGLHGMFNGTSAAAYQASRKTRRMRQAPGALIKSLERFFLKRMHALSGRPALKSLWGTIYVQTGKSAPATVSNFIALAVLLMVVALLLGYYHPHRLAPGISGANLILFLVCTINAEYRVNPYAGLLLNVSRKNRFRSLIFSALTQWLVMAVIAVVMTIVSVAAGRFLGEFTIYDRTYTYIPIHPKAFFVFAPMIPFYLLSQVLFPKRHVIVLMVIATAGIIAFFVIAHVLLEISVAWLLLLQVVSWLPFVAWIRHYCYYWDLKLNGQ